MNIYLSSNFIKSYKNYIRKFPSKVSVIKSEIEFFQHNPEHESLQMHQLKGRLVKEYSFSIESDLRIRFQKIKDGVLFTDIGTHDQVY